MQVIYKVEYTTEIFYNNYSFPVLQMLGVECGGGTFWIERSLVCTR